MLEDNKQKMLNNEVSFNVFSKRLDKITKEKEFLMEDLEK